MATYGLAAYAQELQGRLALACFAMGAFFEEDARIMAHAARVCPAAFVINTIVPRESEPRPFKKARSTRRRRSLNRNSAVPIEQTRRVNSECMVGIPYREVAIKPRILRVARHRT
jgi:hypothetical protein